jgi:hypothetical protein
MTPFPFRAPDETGMEVEHAKASSPFPEIERREEAKHK